MSEPFTVADCLSLLCSAPFCLTTAQLSRLTAAEISDLISYALCLRAGLDAGEDLTPLERLRDGLGDGAFLGPAWLQ